jgi:hypothetical protein
MTGPLGSQQITRLRADTVPDGRHGGFYRDWDNAAATTIGGVSVQPYATAESTLEAAYVADRLHVYAPAGTDLQATDRVIYDGTTFEVDGDAQIWHGLAGPAHHVELVIKRLAG